MIHQPSGGAQVATDMEINLREMLKKDELYIISHTQDRHFDKVHKIERAITG
jgi:ATP-dependent protease ClpP protease subunit